MGTKLRLEYYLPGNASIREGRKEQGEYGFLDSIKKENRRYEEKGETEHIKFALQKHHCWRSIYEDDNMRKSKVREEIKLKINSNHGQNAEMNSFANYTHRFLYTEYISENIGILYGSPDTIF